MNTIQFGPRLVAHPTATLRAALLARPTAAIESAVPLPGEPGAIASRAREQHEVFASTLRFFGVDVTVLDAGGDDPFEPAVADAAIAFEDGAVVMRPTAMSRRGIAERVEAEFARIDVPIAGHVAAPGLLDGGDVLQVAQTIFVGISPSRGNAIGRGGFAAVARAHEYGVVEVPLPESELPLRALASAVARDTIVLAASVDPAPFKDFNTIVLDRGEELAAGMLCLGEHHVVADLRYRTSLAKLHQAGVRVEAIDLYEFTKIGVTPSLLALPLKRTAP